MPGDEQPRRHAERAAVGPLQQQRRRRRAAPARARRGTGPPSARPPVMSGASRALQRMRAERAERHGGEQQRRAAERRGLDRARHLALQCRDRHASFARAIILPQDSTMTIERRHVGKRLSELVVNRAGRAPPISPARSPTTRRPTSPARRSRCWRRSTPAGRSRQRQDADPVGDDLSARHGRFRRDERGVGSVGRAGADAGARDRRGEARQPDYRVEIQVVAAAPA